MCGCIALYWSISVS